MSTDNLDKAGRCSPREADVRAARDRARRLALAVCLAAGFTTLLDSSILNLAVPSLTRSLHASAEQVQWLLSGYSLTFGLALVPAGRAGDLRGRRTLFLGGVGLFAAGSITSALSPTAGVVISAQLLQGVGGGMISSQVLGTIQDMFDGPGRARAMSAYGVASGLAGLTGPLLGALLVTALPPGIGWRAVMAASIPLAAATLILAARHLPRDTAAGAAVGRAEGGALDRGVSDRDGSAPARIRVDAPGLMLLTIATLALVLPFVQPGLTRVESAGLVGAAAAALAAFAIWERLGGSADPAAVILPPVLARAPGFVSGTLVSTFWFGAALAQSAVVTLYLLETLHVQPLLVAAVGLPSSAAGALTASVSWRLVARFGPGVISVALALQALITGTLALVLPHVAASGAVLLLMAVNCLSGMASGCTDSQNRAYTLQHSPDGSRGVAAGFLQLAQRLSATVCLAAATGVAFSRGTAEPSAHGIGLALGLCAVLVLLSLAISLRRATDRLSITSMTRPRTPS
jgi:MFS family permease